MDPLRYLTRNALALPYEPLLSTSRGYWLYAVTSLLLAAVAWASSRDGDRPSVRGFLAFCFPRRVYLHPSAIVDYKLLVVNAVLAPANLVFSSLSVVLVSSRVAATLTGVFGPMSHHLECAGPPLLAYTAGMMLMREFVLYVDHILAHKVPILWEFHKVHHSAEVLTPLTNERKHPIDIVLVMVMVVLGVGLCQGVVLYLLFAKVTVAKLFGIEVFVAIFYLAGAHLRHSHVWLSYGRLLGRVLMSPAQHQIHHSVVPRHVDKNFGEMLSLFDWCFGTAYLPSGPESLKFGLASEPSQPHDGIIRAYLVPFVGAWRHCTGAFRRLPSIGAPSVNA